MEGNTVTDINDHSTTVTPLCVHVRNTVQCYLEHLHGHDAVDLYEIVMAEVEKPLLQVVLEHSGHNQSKTAKVLGLSRSTLRKKMEHYGLS